MSSSYASAHLLRALAPASILALALVGCSDEQPPKAPEEPVADGSGTATKAPTGKQAETVSGVKIDDKIIKACGDLPTARFAFDSAEVSADATAALDALARCFISGPLKGKGMRLVGHADPRGEVEYNLALGQQRAGSVGDFLARKGLEASRMATSSRGEFEASGTDEDGWALDRKVEVFLAE
jgi:peptidoglycan-associated lipoprotein